MDNRRKEIEGEKWGRGLPILGGIYHNPQQGSLERAPIVGRQSSTDDRREENNGEREIEGERYRDMASSFLRKYQEARACSKNMVLGFALLPHA